MVTLTDVNKVDTLVSVYAEKCGEIDGAWQRVKTLAEKIIISEMHDAVLCGKAIEEARPAPTQMALESQNAEAWQSSPNSRRVQRLTRGNNIISAATPVRQPLYASF